MSNAVTENVSMSNAVTENVSMSNAVTENVTMSNAVTENVSMSNAVTENVSMSNAVTENVTMFNAVTENVTMSNAVTENVTMSNAVTEKVSTSQCSQPVPESNHVVFNSATNGVPTEIYKLKDRDDVIKSVTDNKYDFIEPIQLYESDSEDDSFMDSSVIPHKSYFLDCSIDSDEDIINTGMILNDMSTKQTFSSSIEANQVSKKETKVPDIVKGMSDVGRKEVSDVGRKEVSDVGSQDVSDVGNKKVSDVGRKEVSDDGSEEVSEDGSKEMSYFERRKSADSELKYNLELNNEKSYPHGDDPIGRDIDSDSKEISSPGNKEISGTASTVIADIECSEMSNAVAIKTGESKLLFYKITDDAIKSESEIKQVLCEPVELNESDSENELVADPSLIPHKSYFLDCSIDSDEEVCLNADIVTDNNGLMISSHRSPGMPTDTMLATGDDAINSDCLQNTDNPVNTDNDTDRELHAYHAFNEKGGTSDVNGGSASLSFNGSLCVTCANVSTDGSTTPCIVESRGCGGHPETTSHIDVPRPSTTVGSQIHSLDSVGYSSSEIIDDLKVDFHDSGLNSNESITFIKASSSDSGLISNESIPTTKASYSNSGLNSNESIPTTKASYSDSELNSNEAITFIKASSGDSGLNSNETIPTTKASYSDSELNSNESITFIKASYIDSGLNSNESITLPNANSCDSSNIIYPEPCCHFPYSELDYSMFSYDSDESGHSSDAHSIIHTSGQRHGDNFNVKGQEKATTNERLKEVSSEKTDTLGTLKEAFDVSSISPHTAVKTDTSAQLSIVPSALASSDPDRPAIKEAEIVLAYNETNTKETDIRETGNDEADIRGTDFEEISTKETYVRETGNDEADIRGTDFEETCIKEADISETDIKETQVKESGAGKTDICETHIKEADLKRTDTIEMEIKTPAVQAAQDSLEQVLHGLNVMAQPDSARLGEIENVSSEYRHGTDGCNEAVSKSKTPREVPADSEKLASGNPVADSSPAEAGGIPVSSTERGICLLCRKPSDDMVHCYVCGKVKYCSERCLNADRINHTEACVRWERFRQIKDVVCDVTEPMGHPLVCHFYRIPSAATGSIRENGTPEAKKGYRDACH